MTEHKNIVADFERVQQDRSTWEALWRDIADLVMPRRDFTSDRVKGAERHQHLFDTTAVRANSQLAAGLESFLVNPRTKWFELRTGDAALDQNTVVMEWLQKVRDKILNHFASRDSNFYPAVHEGFQDIGAFGTMVHFIGETVNGKPRFTARPIAEIFVRSDDRFDVDTVYRKYRLTAKQMRDAFGEDALPDSVKQSLENNKLGDHFDIVHAVFPRGTFDPNAAQTKSNMPFASIHILMSGKGKGTQIGEESGFRDFPFTVARWSKAAGETYGRSPSMEVLGDIRMLQKMNETVIKAAQKIVDPPLLAPDDGFLHPLRTQPGSVNFFRASRFASGSGQNPSGLTPLLTNAQPDFGQQMIQDRQSQVQEAYLLREILGLISRGDSSPLKATEVVGRQQQALRQLAPILARLQDEFLIPAVDRTFNIMFRNGELPPVPDELRGQNVEVRFVSQAATAQQASENENMLNWLQQIFPVLEVDQNAAFNIDTDALVRKAAEANNVPAEVLNSREQVEQRRSQAAQRQQQQSALERLQQAGQAAGTLSEAGGTLSEITQRGQQ